MREVNIHEAKTHLSRLVKDAAAGHTFIIARAGKPLVKVIPYVAEAAAGQQRLGFMASEISVPDDFDHMDSAAVTASFCGDDE